MDKIEFLDKVKEFEGCRLSAYKCPSGVLTIGYGHTHGVYEGMVIAPQTATIFFAYDIELVVAQLCSYHRGIGDVLPESAQFALVDFVFNVGFSRYKRSTLCKVVSSIVESKHFDNSSRWRISVELQKWCFAKGKKLRGLEKRRNWECELLYMD